jgi:hypothetical protein
VPRGKAVQIKTTSGSGAAGLGIVGTGLALALPDIKWIGWLLVAAGLVVFLFDVRIERGHVAIGSPQSLGQRLKRMWPQYLMVFSACLFLVGLVAFLQINVTQLVEVHQPPPPPRPLVALANSQLREKTKAMASELRALELEYDRQLALLDYSGQDRSKRNLLQAEKTAKFNQNFLGQVRMLQSELWIRLYIDGYQNPFGVTDGVLYSGDSVIRTGILAGPHPVSSVAIYLEEMANRLE